MKCTARLAGLAMILLASIPQTARVSRKDVKAPAVAYEGDPKFEPIPSTQVARAVKRHRHSHVSAIEREQGGHALCAQPLPDPSADAQV